MARAEFYTAIKLLFYTPPTLPYPTPVISMNHGVSEPKKTNDSVWVTYERFLQSFLLPNCASTKSNDQHSTLRDPLPVSFNYVK